MKQNFIIYYVNLLFIFMGCQSIEKKITFIDGATRGNSHFIHVGKSTQGQWWLIDSNGRPFFYKGVCAINRAGTAGGRRAKPGKYAITIDKKYNYQQAPDSFVNSSITYLKKLRFNALGAWTTEEFYNKGIFFTEILEFFYEGPYFNATKLPDIFSSEWEYAIDKKARALCSPLRESKDLVGYFTDNEIGFGNINTSEFDLGFKAGDFKPTLLRQLLELPEEKEAFQAAAKFVIERHGNNFKELSNNWGLDIPNWDSFRSWSKKKLPIQGEAYKKDTEAFVGYYASCYFKKANKAIKRYDPNHLILGCRFGAPPPKEILSAIIPWTDVISVNNYQPILYERYDSIYKQSEIPFLIGEFSWNTPLYKEVLFPSEKTSQMDMKERMFKRGETTLKRAALQDGFVGYTWYRWVQHKAVEPKFSDGIVDYEDNPSIHNDMLKNINKDMETLRIKYANGKWKQAEINNGEMTFFFNKLRKNWDHYVRVEFKNGKPIKDNFGWKTHLMILDFKSDSDGVFMKFKINFNQGNTSNDVPESSGTYEIRMIRNNEIFTGELIGQYEGEKIKGNVKAYYFPQLEISDTIQ
ncbi:hypothetical protein [uncultured Parabacteroides sp.]|uniref:hypothetical protein n=1 Tax=uncultured Parabacteroides sp. TaxID=512312 RepID=UPI0025D30048|nr:hypothetical protein [uncultured Parabacteroides sp.]